MNGLNSKPRRPRATITQSILGLGILAAFGFGAFQESTSASSARRLDFVSLESLNFDEVCGEDSAGKTRCLKSGSGSTWIPDGVGRLTRTFANKRLGCGFDEDGLKCWRLPGADFHGGIPEAEAIRQLMLASDIELIRLSSSHICGISKKHDQLKCLVTNWTGAPNQTISISSKNEIHTLAISDFVLCWAERGRNLNSKISCQTSFPKIIKLPAIPNFKSLTEMSVGYDWVCARSKSKAQCWSETSAPLLDAAMVEAKSWHTAHNYLCALTKDNRVICVDPKTGKSMAPDRGHVIPQEYADPNPDVESLWISPEQSCVVTAAKTSGREVYCWTRWTRLTQKVEYGPTLDELFGSGNEPCGRFLEGRVRCRLTYTESQTLSKIDRVRVEFGGYNKCFWNSSGVDCRGRFDDINYRSVKSLAASREEESLCVVGVRADQASNFDTVQCYSYYADLNTPPFELFNPTSVAISADKACAISDDGLTCWGGTYSEVPMPVSVLNPKKVLMGRSHACALDDFGLVCWGELTALKLEVPSSLQQPGRIVDFALGRSRTCAVLDTGNVECWGRDYELSGPPPKMTTVKAIVGRGGLFCALDNGRVRCWGGESGLPK